MSELRQIQAMTPLARRSPIPPSECNLGKAIDLLGDRWTLLILRSALYGVRRFSDFQSELDCPRTVLAGRLKALTEAGLLRKKTYQEPGKRTRPEYVLTKSGQNLRLALVALTQWGDQHFADGSAPPVSFVSPPARSLVKTCLIDATGAEVDPNKLRPVLRR